MNKDKADFHDPFLRHIKDIKCPLGLTPHDAAKLQPGHSIARSFENIRDQEQKRYPKPDEYILSQGTACGLDDSENCVHFWAGRVPHFIGFLIGSSEREATVKTRGSIVLKIEGATDADRGKPVYCSGPNTFSLENSPGAAEIGRIRYVQDNSLAAVAFKRYDSEKPLNLSMRS